MKKFLFKLIKLTAVIGLPCILNAQNLKLKDESEEPNQYMKDVDSAVMSVSDISPPIDHKLRKLQRLEMKFQG